MVKSLVKIDLVKKTHQFQIPLGQIKPKEKERGTEALGGNYDDITTGSGTN